MKKRITCHSTLMCAVAFLLFSGCASTGRTDLVEKGAVTVKPVEAQGFTLPAPSVYSDKTGVMISGRWRQSEALAHGADPGHVHVVITSSDGKFISDRGVPVTVKRTGTPRMRRTELTYSSRHPSDLPPGAIVKVWHCHDDHPLNEKADG